MFEISVGVILEVFVRETSKLFNIRVQKEKRRGEEKKGKSNHIATPPLSLFLLLLIT